MWKLLNIPKIAYFYWGNRTIQLSRAISPITFKRLNPDWDVILYVPKEEFSGTLPWAETTKEHAFDIRDGKNHIDMIATAGVRIEEIDLPSIGISNNLTNTTRSDILRLYLLSRPGGLWADMDTIFFEPIDSLECNTDEMSSTDTVLCHTNKPYPYHNVALLLSSRGNALFSALYDSVGDALDESNYQSVGSCMFNDVVGFDTTIDARLHCQHRNLPMDVFYAYDCHNVRKLYSDNARVWFTERSIGMHWYAGHFKAAEMSGINDIEGFASKQNSVGYAIRRFLSKTGGRL